MNKPTIGITINAILTYEDDREDSEDRGIDLTLDEDINMHHVLAI